MELCYDDETRDCHSAVFCCATVEAQIVPGGLMPGDQFRYVFVTSTTTNANSTNIGTYNAFVNTAAANNSNLVNHPTLGPLNFNAIGSTETVDAIDNTGTNAGGADVPIFLLDGTQVAVDNADLWDGDIGAAINLDENLNIVQERVWSGSTNAGIDVADFELGAVPLVRLGFSGSRFDWLFDTVSTTGDFNHMYALSDPITVPVPEPTAATLLLLGGLGLIGMRRRK